MGIPVGGGPPAEIFSPGLSDGTLLVARTLRATRASKQVKNTHFMVEGKNNLNAFWRTTSGRPHQPAETWWPLASQRMRKLRDELEHKKKTIWEQNESGLYLKKAAGFYLPEIKDKLENLFCFIAETGPFLW